MGMGRTKITTSRKVFMDEVKKFMFIMFQQPLGKVERFHAPLMGTHWHIAAWRSVVSTTMVCMSCDGRKVPYHSREDGEQHDKARDTQYGSFLRPRNRKDAVLRENTNLDHTVMSLAVSEVQSSLVGWESHPIRH